MNVMESVAPESFGLGERAVVRPFAPDDYEGFCAMRNAIRPDYPITAEQVRREDSQVDPKCRHGRWVAEVDGEIIGCSSYWQFEWMYHPRKFGVMVAVHPARQRQGLGTRLYDDLMEHMAEFDPISLRTFAREDDTASIRFIVKRGFEAEFHGYESRLDVTAFDFTPYEGLEEKVREHGVEIRTFREVMDAPGFLRKLYDALGAIDRDVSAPEPLTTPEFDRWLEMWQDSPNLLPDGYFIAMHGDDPVGVSQLWKADAHDDLETGLTGVLREWRRKGIATALKVRAIRYAREQGCATIRTHNDAKNRPMLSINERLGFVKLPAWVDYVKTFSS